MKNLRMVTGFWKGVQASLVLIDPGNMTTPDQSPNDVVAARRGRKSRTAPQQTLAEARKQLVQAQAHHEKALARVERERLAELAQTGRRIFLAAIEQLHSGERGLLVDPVLAGLTDDDRSIVQVWLESLLKTKKNAN